MPRTSFFWNATLALVLISLSSPSYATVWFGVSSETHESIIVGLSSGAIIFDGGDSDSKSAGHFSLEGVFVGVGALTIPSSELISVSALLRQPVKKEDLIRRFENGFPNRRFIFGHADGSISIAVGKSGCNETNRYCGGFHVADFSIVGGGLESENVITYPSLVYLTHRHRTSVARVANKVVNSIAYAGGEVEYFKYGVVWHRSKEGTVRRFLAQEPNEEILVEKLQKEIDRY